MFIMLVGGAPGSGDAVGSVVCFADEGGGFAPCRTLCVSIVCFEKDASLDLTPRQLYERLRLLLSWRRGELKWRSVKKAAARRGIQTEELLKLIASEALCLSTARMHMSGGVDGGEAKRLLFREAVSKLRCSRVDVLVADAHLVPVEELRSAARSLGASYARMVDSRRYPGVQIADLLAGACSEGMWD